MTKINKYPILVVDNDLVHRRIIERLGINRNLICYHAKSGIDGLNLSSILQFKFIFIDIDMPTMSGIDFAKKLREQENKFNLPRTPLIAMSSSFQMKGSIAIQNAIIFDYQIEKPIKFNKFNDIIQSILSANIVNEPEMFIYSRVSN